MDNKKRVLFNSLAMYVKLIVTTIISLFLTRIVLKVLGEEDYGIFALIGSTVALMSFLQGALMIASQRFLSIALGENNKEKVKNVYISSVIIHLIIAFILFVILEVASIFLFDGFLNINSNRIEAAKVVYHLTVTTVVITILSIPFNAVINANEDLWLFATVEIIIAILKIGVIIVFYLFPTDTLITYTVWVTILTVFGILLKGVWCWLKYPECRNLGINYNVHKPIVKDMLGFTGWNAFGSIAMIGRNQGLALILNIFFGTFVNTLYAIANQLNAQLIFVAQMTTQSITPQIMKSKGEGNVKRMIQLSIFTSKLAFFLSAVFAIPLLLELPLILKFWLGNVPKGVEIYCQLLLYTFIVMELYPGIVRLIQADGRIMWLQIITTITLLLPLPIGCILFTFGYPHYYVLYVMLLSQVLEMIGVLYIAHHNINLDIYNFVIFLLKAMLSFGVLLVLGMQFHVFLCNYFGEIITFLIDVPISIVIFFCCFYYLILDKSERLTVKTTLQNILKRN